MSFNNLSQHFQILAMLQHFRKMQPDSFLVVNDLFGGIWKNTTRKKMWDWECFPINISDLMLTGNLGNASVSMAVRPFIL